MKTRYGFVSNSSSSSFVISGDKDSDFSTKLVIPIDLNEYVEKSISNESDLLEYLADCGYSSMEDILDSKKTTERYNKFKDQLKLGKVIKVLEFSSEDYDNPIGELIYNFGLKEVLPNNLTILESDY